MSTLTLVLGGTRSGKSEIAERLAAESGRGVLYLATCRPGDEDLEIRVRIHRARRPPEWGTVETPTDPVAESILGERPDDLRLLECLSLLVFNWMEEGASDGEIAGRCARLLAHARAEGAPWIIVSNDVSGALLPPDPYTRRYQDLLGRMNQQAAAAADRVLLAVAGLSVVVK